MAKQSAKRMWVKDLRDGDKATIAERCDRFIQDELKPRFLPQIRPTEFNYPVDIFGRWRGSKYSFIQRYWSGFSENLGEEFNAAFTRLDHCEGCLTETRFDVMWHRHTGQWFRLYPFLTLDQALERICTDELLWPIS
jgi:hypothetical protein